MSSETYDLILSLPTPLLQRISCNESTERRLDRVLAESARREPADGGGARRLRSEEPRGPLPLGLEGGQRCSDALGVDAPPFEVVPDRGVTITPSRQRFGAPAGKAAVVDEAAALERGDRLGARSRDDAAPLEAQLQLPAREVAGAQRASGLPQGLAGRFRETRTATSPALGARRAVGSLRQGLAFSGVLRGSGSVEQLSKEGKVQGGSLVRRGSGGQSPPVHLIIPARRGKSTPDPADCEKE